jgi:hypothetical protein
MQKLLIIFLLIPTLSFAVEINLSCQVEAVFNSCEKSNCKEKVESGAADISVIDLKHFERLSISLRFKDNEWIHNHPVDQQKGAWINEYIHTEREWIIADTYSSDKMHVKSRIEIDRYTGKVYLKQNMSFAVGGSNDITVSGDCKKDDDSKQRF